MLEKFHHTLPDGFELTLPRYENVEAGILRKIRRLSPVDQLFTLLEHYLDEEQLEHFDKLNVEELGALSKAWREGSAVGLGESSAS